MSLISVIIPAHNAATILPACLTALRQQSHPADEIIVVDDGSTDETVLVAKSLGAICLTQSRQGPAVARNLGVAHAHGDLVLFTDADCEPFPDWIAQMIAPFADAQVMGAKGTYRTRQTQVIARLVQLEYERRYERMRTLPRIDFIDTYSAAYRHLIISAYGGFDKSFSSNRSAEDIDLAFRLARAGHWLAFAPDAHVWHLHPTSLGNYFHRKASYGWWRALLYLRYPEKTSGDAHTDPALKSQFVLVALAIILMFGGWIWQPLWWGVVAALIIFEISLLPFTRWAWSRDRTVALLWLPISLARVAVQGTGLALGLVWHGLIMRRAP